VLANTCTCSPGHVTNLIGPTACGPPISSHYNVSNEVELAQQLCSHYSRYKELMQQVRAKSHGGSASASWHGCWLQGTATGNQSR